MAINRKLSDGFAGTGTKQSGGVEKEVESRLKKLDVFTDEFSPPGTGESGPGFIARKLDEPFETKHDDIASSEPNNKPYSPNSEFDVHAVDPARLKAEIKKTFGVK